MFRSRTRGALQRALAAALVVATTLAGLSSPAAGADAPLVIEATADALVKSGARNTNFGTSATLEADKSPAIESYLQFTVSDAAAPVARATLQLFATAGTENGPVLYPSAPSWTEAAITWANRPARTGPAAGNLKRFRSNTWVEYDLTSLITGNGTYSFTLVADSSDGVAFRSRETSGKRPRLVVELASPPEPDTTPPGTVPATTGIIDTVAGNGTLGGGGNGGPAVLGQFREPRTLAIDASGNVYVADTYNHSIRKIDTAGVITTVAGTGKPGYSGDGGPATAAKLETPHSVALDAAGNLYIADSPNHRIRKVDHAGIITTIVGSGASGSSGDGGPATAARLNYPKGVEIGADGLLYFADSLNHRIRRVDAAGIITTVAGTGVEGYSGDGGPATAAKLHRPRNVVVDAAGVLWIADDLNYRVRRVGPDGVITTYAGTGVSGYSGDGGPATAAKFSQVRDIAVDAAGNVFVADELNNRIRRIDAGGTITTYAGTGTQDFSGDGGPATAAELNHPRGVAIGPDGLLVVADTFNHRIRKVS